MTPFDVQKTAVQKEALLTEGHFLLSSGLHSDTYFQCAKILQWPDAATECGRALAALLPKDRIDAVVSPAMGGLFIGHEVARALGVRHIFVERVDNVFQMKRGFEVKQGERLAVIEDVVTTAKSTAEVIAFLRADGRGEVTAVGSIANRVEDSRMGEVAQKLGGLEPKYLLKVSAKAYDAKDCPMCREGKKPLVKPGSRKI
ncbi:MAG: orotate phosphoribosyltransferase [Candidatus Omnitrophica bacterium]|nr:orotate phosphoribosyltransferase [Candidatus Omnitrophota bacterium]